MPRFNLRGQVCAGVGDGIVSIDRVEVARGGGAEWLDDDRVIFGGHWTDGTWKLLCYDQRTTQVSLLADCEVNFLAGSGGEYFAVGAHSLAASFPISSPRWRTTPTATDGRGAGDRQGTIALSDLTGQGFTLRAKDGTEITAAAGVACYGLTVVSATQAFWPANGGFDSIGLPPIKVVGPPGRGCYCVVNGRPWIVYYRDGLGLIVHPADDASRIQVIESAPIFFHYDAIAKDGTIRVTYATTPSEAPHEVVIRNLDLSQLAPVRPKIAVLSYDPVFKSGEKWASQFRVNDLTITVRKDATDNLYFDAENAAGSDHTGLVRHLTIVGQKQPEPPMKSTRFWCQPNIGSTDLLDLFDDMTRFDGVEVFVLYSQHLTQDQPNAQWGQNTYPNFVARDAFRKLDAAGIPLAMEGGFSEGDLVAIDRVAAAGGQLHYVSVSEPLTYAKQHGQSVDAIADTVARYTKQAKDRGATHVGWLEAWPEIPFVAIESYFAKLHDRAALPDYLHLDIDWNRAAHEHQDPAKFIAQCKHLAFFYGIPLGVFINSTIDPITPDGAHHDNLIALAKRVAAIDPDLAQVHVASWALRTKNGPQDVPQNLGPVGMLQTCAEIKPLFHQLPEAPDPEPGSQEKDMIAKFKDPLTGLPVVAKMLPKAGTPYVTLVRPDGRVWSCQPDGTLDTRSAGSDGTYEQCRVEGGIATFLPIRADESNPALKPFIGQYHSFGFTFFEGL